MSSLRYSTPALNVLNRFYRVEFVVFVEGLDDKIFWEVFFKKADVGECFVKQLGGIDEMEKIMKRILDEDAQVIVACDCGHTPYLSNYPRHERIVTTFGHSIENTMYCFRTINRTISKLSRNTKDMSQTIQEWIAKFSETAKPMIIYDIANVVFEKSIQVFGENCCRFLTRGGSHDLSPQKIDIFLKSIRPHFEEKEVQECERMVEEDERDLRYLIKGHFLTHAVLNYIKNSVRRERQIKLNLPIESLFALTVDGCENCACDCFESAEVTNRIRVAASSLNPLC